MTRRQRLIRWRNYLLFPVVVVLEAILAAVDALTEPFRNMLEEDTDGETDQA